MADNILEFTPMTYTPNMNGPAWPDNSRKVIEITPARLPTEEPKSDKKKAGEKKRWDYDPTVSMPWPGTELMFGSDRFGAPKNPFGLPTGPFNDNLRVPRVGMPVPAGTRIAEDRPREEPKDSRNWFQRLFGPDQSELEAERNGLRWHWALEHRFMPPGSKWNETVWNGVDRENAWLTQLLKQKAMEEGKDVNGIMTPMARVRAMGLDKQKWDNFIKGIKDGHYSSMGEITPEALQWAEDFKRMYDSKWGKGSSGELTPIPTVIGKRSDLMKKQNFDVRGALNDTQDAMQNLYDWSKDGSFKDPIKSQMIKNYLDKISQSLSALLGGDSKSMADAEKVRIQILYLPEKSMDMVKREIVNFRDMLESVMEYGRSKGWSQNIIGKINRAKEAANRASQANGKGNISTLAGMAVSAVGDIMPSLTPQEREQAIGLQEGLESAKLAHENYMQNMVLAADVDPALVYQFAEVLQNKLAKQYNAEMENAERPERAKLMPKFDIDLGQLQREVEPSPFLKPINYRKFFTEISLPERGPGANPSDVIEQGQGDGLSTSTAKTVDKINLGK